MCATALVYHQPQLRATAAEDPDSGVALLCMCEAAAATAAAAITKARRCVRKSDSAKDMVALTAIAGAKVLDDDMCIAKSKAHPVNSRQFAKFKSRQHSLRTKNYT